ncbi:phosphatase PAP2 family protein [Chryseobacterium indologenes]|uniref:Phosphatase PAP2 family protein n=1 Tax=Chitinophaga pollutisoli TaxID=3133966 RepID=A0ABZ2YL02_9BACT|nr:phosphatase PAP2 family protein [Chryseobacterium indologenes]MDM1555402.1 phosphatase PAP2 family protein [Chryseobacterium indologenes]
MRHLLLILILCVYQLGIAQTDSLVTGQKMDQSFDHAYQFKYKKLIVPSVFIGYGILSLTSDDLKQLNRSTQYEIGEHQPDKIKLDNYTQYVPAILVYGLNAIGLKGKHNLKDRSIILGTSLLISSAVVLPTKHLVREERPDGSNNLSFPSGHTTTAFTTAHFMFREYQDENIWLSLSGYPIAVFTGVYRILNDKHWVGDVVAGAGIGILSTEVAYWLFPKVSKLFSKDHSKNSALVYPFYQNKTMGLGLSLNF